MNLRSHRLHAGDVADTLTHGSRIVHHPFRLHLVKRSGDAPFRFTVIVPKRVDKLATARNRSKRLVREAVYSYLSALPAGFDVVIFITRSISKQGIVEVKQLVGLLFRSSRLLSGGS